MALLLPAATASNPSNVKLYFPAGFESFGCFGDLGKCTRVHVWSGRCDCIGPTGSIIGENPTFSCLYVFLSLTELQKFLAEVKESLEDECAGVH